MFYIYIITYIAKAIRVSILGGQIHIAERHLKNQYEFTQFISTEEWPLKKPQCFIRIALVQHRGTEKCKDEIIKISILRKAGGVRTVPKKFDNYRSSSLRHSLKPYSLKVADEFLKNNKVVKNVKDIFQSTNFKAVTIEGVAGIGKTYLCKEIAYQWSQEQIFPEKKLLFLLFLCEQRVQSLNSVKDLVAFSCKQENNESVELITHYLQCTEGESLVLILDGYNEISEKLPDDSFINDILKRIYLPKCMLIITARSSAYGLLYHLADCRIEILGFTENDRQEYIKQAFKDSSSDIAMVKQYFVNNPTISSLCYIPLNMAIFTYLFYQKDCPKTYTELYQKFIDSMVKHHVKKSGQPHENFQELTDTIILNLGTFSYNVLCKDQMIFSFAEIKDACPDIVAQLPGAMHDGFGLLQVTKHFDAMDPEETFTVTFSHSSIRDCLAALYIKSLSDDKQINLLKDTFWNEKYLNTWIMFVGLTQGKSIAFKTFLAGKQSIRLSVNPNHINISPEIMNDKLKCLHLFQCFKEASDTEMYARVGESFENDQIDLSGKTLLPNHVFTLSSFLVQSWRYTSSWDKLDLSSCNMHDISCFMLLKELDCQEARICIKKIDLSYNNLTEKFAGTLASLVQKCATTELAISGNQLGNVGAEYFSSCLVGNRTLELLMMDGNNVASNLADKIEIELTNSTSLKIIGITSNQLYVRNECGSHIIEVLQQYSTLTKFTMCYCSVSIEDMIIILRLLAKNLNLNTIHFSHNDLGRMKMNAYTSELSTLNCLSSLTLVEPEMPYTAADELLDAVNFNMNAKVVALSNLRLKTVQASCMEISQILRSNPSIVILEIPQVFRNEESIDLLMTAVQATPVLQKIDISQNNLYTAGIQKFVTAIKNATNLKSLIMRSNDINKDAAEALANGLKNKTSLEVLDLGVNRMHTKGAIKISQALKNNTTLKVLNLHNNSIESSAAEEISLMLTNKEKLVEINISQNSFKSEGIIIIAKVLRTISSLKIINLSLNKITSEASDHISSVLRNNLLLESLNMSHNKIKTPGCISICKALKHQHHNLKVLNIGCNEIESEAAYSIAHSLKGKSELETFIIHGNRLHTGLTAIISELKFTTKKLKTLNFNASGKINHKAAQNLCHVICENPLLEMLDVSSTQLRKSEAGNIFNALTNNKTLKVLNASYNQFDDVAAEKLTRSLSNNFLLRELKLHGNPVSDRAIQQIVFEIKTDNLRHIKVPRINDEDIKSAITTRIKRINRSKKANNQLELFSSW